MSANNVVLFPGVKSVVEPAPLSLQELRQRNISFIVEQIGDLYLQLLKQYNIKASTDVEFLKDTTFMKEAIKNAAMRASGIEHPFQKLVDTMFDTEETEDDITIIHVPLAYNKFDSKKGTK